MPVERLSDELEQAMELLNRLSKTKQSVVTGLIRALAQDEGIDVPAHGAVAQEYPGPARSHVRERASLGSGAQAPVALGAMRRGRRASRVPGLA